MSPKEHVRTAAAHLAMAMAKSIVAGIRIPDVAYRADVALGEWEAELEKREVRDGQAGRAADLQRGR